MHIRLLKSFDRAQDERLRNSVMSAIPLMVSPSNHRLPRYSCWLMAYGLSHMGRMFQVYAISYQPYAEYARLASEIFLSSLQPEFINQDAKWIGLTIPLDLLARATKIIK